MQWVEKELEADSESKDSETTKIQEGLWLEKAISRTAESKAETKAQTNT